MSSGLGLLASYAPQFLSGLKLTLASWLLGSALALILGFALALISASQDRFLSAAVRTYVEVLRGTPLLVQLFVFYYGGPGIGVTLNALTVGVIGLGLYGSAYFAEIFRSGFDSIPKGQLDAAHSFGFSRSARLVHIVIPQMLALIIPPSTNLLIILLKDTAVLSVITVPELTFQVTGMTVETFTFVGPFVGLAVVYWLLTEATALLGRQLEWRVGAYLRP